MLVGAVSVRTGGLETDATLLRLGGAALYAPWLLVLTSVLVIVVIAPLPNCARVLTQEFLTRVVMYKQALAMGIVNDASGCCAGCGWPCGCRGCDGSC